MSRAISLRNSVLEPLSTPSIMLYLLLLLYEMKSDTNFESTAELSPSSEPSVLLLSYASGTKSLSDDSVSASKAALNTSKGLTCPARD